MDRTFPFFHLKGTHREMGRQLGEACRQNIELHRDLALERLGTRAGISPQKACDLALQYRPSVIQVAPFLDEEIQGVAEGAGLSLAEAYVLQLRAELASPIKETSLWDESDECTTFSVLSGGTANQVTITGQNADLPGFYRDIGVVLEICSPDLPKVLMFTPAGQISHIGINDRGLAVFANFLKSGGWQIGCPRYLYSRLVLTKDSTLEGARLVETVKRASSRNLMITDRQDQALDLEIAPDRIGRTEPVQDILVHTNHFIAVDMLDAEERTDTLLMNSKIRLSRIRELLESNHGCIDVEVMKSILRDRACYPDAICRMPGDWEGDTITIASVITQPARGEMWIAVGPPNEYKYHKYTFTDELNDL